MSHIDIIFDGPPGPDGGRFVDVENADGQSIGFGEWIERPDGFWALRHPSRIALVEALQSIARGSFSGASSLAIAGDWHSFVAQLQTIAKAALDAETA